MRVQSLGWVDFLEEGIRVHPSILAGGSHEPRTLEGYSPWGRRKLDTTEAAYHVEDFRVYVHN